MDLSGESREAEKISIVVAGERGDVNFKNYTPMNTGRCNIKKIQKLNQKNKARALCQIMSIVANT